MTFVLINYALARQLENFCICSGSFAAINLNLNVFGVYYWNFLDI